MQLGVLLTETIVDTCMAVVPKSARIVDTGLQWQSDLLTNHDLPRGDNETLNVLDVSTPARPSSDSTHSPHRWFYLLEPLGMFITGVGLGSGFAGMPSGQRAMLMPYVGIICLTVNNALCELYPTTRQKQTFLFEVSGFLVPVWILSMIVALLVGSYIGSRWVRRGRVERACARVSRDC